MVAAPAHDYLNSTFTETPTSQKKSRRPTVLIHPDDAERLGVTEGGRVRCVSRRAALDVVATITDTLLPGVVTLPHGYGLDYPDAQGNLQRIGPRVNELTSAGWCDPFTGIPYHKYVPVRLERIG